MLTIEQYRQLWQLLACLSQDVSVVGSYNDCNEKLDSIYRIMSFCESILEEN